MMMNHVRTIHRANFARVLQLNGSSRPYFRSISAHQSSAVSSRGAVVAGAAAGVGVVAWVAGKYITVESQNSLVMSQYIVPIAACRGTEKENEESQAPKVDDETINKAKEGIPEDAKQVEEEQVEPAPVQVVFPSDDFHTEETTELKFPKTLNIEGTKVSFCGAGARKKMFRAVYAMGLYIDIPAMRKTFGGEPLDEDIYPQLMIGSPWPRTLRISLNRKIPIYDLMEQFQFGTRNRLKSMMSNKDANELLRDFPKLFPEDGHLERGSEVLLSWKGTSLVVHINGVRTGQMPNELVAKCLFENFLGEEPVEDSARPHMVAFLEELYEKGA